jgi:hypothetical protein
MELAFYNKPDGYHVKRVVRRSTPEVPAPVPYLPGLQGKSKLYNLIVF